MTDECAICLYQRWPHLKIVNIFKICYVDKKNMTILTLFVEYFTPISCMRQRYNDTAKTVSKSTCDQVRIVSAHHYMRKTSANPHPSYPSKHDTLN